MRNIKIISKTFKTVFGTWGYVALAFVVASAILVFAIWLPNLSLVVNTVFSSTLGIGQKLEFLVASLGALNTNFSVISRIITVAVSLLFGVNVAFVFYYFKQRAKLQKGALGMGGIGAMSGLLGVGCASCGSLLLSSLLGVGTTTAFIGILPLRGAEFGLLSMILLGFSIISIAKKLDAPLACKVPASK